MMTEEMLVPDDDKTKKAPQVEFDFTPGETITKAKAKEEKKSKQPKAVDDFDFTPGEAISVKKKESSEPASSVSTSSLERSDLRVDGTKKGNGFLGILKRPDGGVSTEISIGVNIDGKETEIPTLIPTLSKDERDYLLSTPVDKIREANPKLYSVIEQKAVDHAKQRLAKGRSPFVDAGDFNKSAVDRDQLLENVYASQAAIPEFTVPKKAFKPVDLTPGSNIPSAPASEQFVLFNPEGTGYDEYTAKQYKLGPDETGHWPSRAPLTRRQAFDLGLPQGSGIILKGRGHPTFDKTIEGEREAGYQIVQRYGRYYSVPNSSFDPTPGAIKEMTDANPVKQDLKSMMPLPEVFEALPEKDKPGSAMIMAHKLSSEKKYDASNAILDLVEDKTGYAEKLKGHNLEMVGDDEGAKQMYIAAYQKNPNDLNTLAKIAMTSVESSDFKTAIESADQYVAQTGGVANGNESVAMELSLMNGIKAGQFVADGKDDLAAQYYEKAKYWEKNAEQLKLVRQNDELAHTLQTMPDYLLASGPGAIIFGPGQAVAAGVENIVDAFQGTEQVVVNGKKTTIEKPLDAWDRVVSGLVGLWEVGMGAGMLSFAGWGGIKGARGLGTGIPSVMQNLQRVPKNTAMQQVVGFVFPEMAEFNLVLQGGGMVMPSEIYNWITAPVSAYLEKAGIDEEQLSKTQKGAVSIGNMFGLIMMSKAAHAIANRTPEATLKTVNKVREWKGQEPLTLGDDVVPEYVRYAKKAYDKYAKSEPMAPEEAQMWHDAIQDLTVGEMEMASTLDAIYSHHKEVASELSRMQDQSPDPTYRMGNTMYKTAEELKGNVDALVKEGVDPSTIDVQIGNDIEGGKMVTEALDAHRVEFEKRKQPPLISKDPGGSRLLSGEKPAAEPVQAGVEPAPEPAPAGEPAPGTEATPIEGTHVFTTAKGYEIYSGEKGHRIKGPAGGEIPEMIQRVTVTKGKYVKGVWQPEKKKVVMVKNPQYTAIMKEYAKSDAVELDRGRKAFETEEGKSQTEAKDQSSIIAEVSENPMEVADEYFRLKGENPSERMEPDFREEVISEQVGRVIGGEKEDIKGSFVNSDDIANVTPQMRMNWFGEKGETLDVIAERVNSMYGDQFQEAGLERVTEKDIADFIKKYPGGHKQYSKSQIDPTFQKLRDRFYELTGMEVDWVEHRVNKAGVEKEQINESDEARSAELEEWATKEIEREGLTVENLNDFEWLYSERDFKNLKEYLENGRKEEANRQADLGNEVPPDDVPEGEPMEGQPKPKGEAPPKAPADPENPEPGGEPGLGDFGKNAKSKPDLVKEFEAKIEAVDRKLATAQAERKAKEAEISARLSEQGDLFDQGKKQPKDMTPEELNVKEQSDKETIRKALEPIDAEIAELQRQRLKLEKDRDAVIAAAEAQGDLFGEGGDQFSKDSYADTGDRTEGQRPAEPTDTGTVKWIEFPDMVSIVENLLGHVPYVKKLQANIRGMFHHSGSIDITRDLFKSENFDQLVKTLGHEIGHAIDWLPNKLMNRGNILGRIASLVDYRKSWLPFKKGWPGELTPDDIKRFKEEAKASTDDIVIEKQIDEEIVTTTGVTPDDILNIWNAVEKVTNEKLHDYIKGLNTAQKKAIILQAMKGLVPDDLKRFQSEVRTKTGKKITIQEIIKGNWKDKFKKLVDEELKKRKLWKDSEVYREAYEASKKWRPFDENAVSKKHLKYRQSGEEVYADMMSMLLNDPGMLQREAPKFYEAFFNYLSQKPEFKAEYDAIQEILHDPLNFNADRWMKQANKDAAEALAKMAEIPVNRAKIDHSIGKWRLFLHEFVDWNIEAYRNISNKGAFGANLSPKQSLRNKLEMMKFVSNLEFVLAEKGNDIVAPMHKAGISIDDFNNLLRAEANLGFRLEKANPRGWQQDYNQQIIDRIRSKYSPEQAAIMTQSVKDFHNLVFDIMQQGRDVGLFSDEVWAIIENNKDSYVTTWLVDKIEDKWLGPKLYEAKGTLGAAAPPFQATLIKMSAIVRQIEQQKAALALIGAHKSLDVEAMPDAKVSMQMDAHGKQRFVYQAPEGMALLYYYDKGKLKAKVTDRYVAQAMKTYTPNQITSIARAMVVFNKGFKPFVTKYNPSFAFYTNIIKDATRSLPNMYAISRATATPLQWATDMLMFPIYHASQMPKSAKKALNLEKGLLSSDVSEMVVNGAFDVSIGILNNYDPVMSPAGDVLFLKMKSSNGLNSGIEALAKKNKIVEGLSWIHGLYESGAGAMEIQTKITWYNFLKKRGYSPEAAAFYVRNYAGTPNWSNKGTQTINSNEILPFSNVITQGQRSDFELATSFKDAPKTALGYWLYTAIHTMVPATVMGMAFGGAFGGEIQRYVRGIPKFYLSNYSVLPLGYVVEKVSEGLGYNITSPLFVNVPQEGLQSLTNAAVFEIVSNSVDKDAAWDMGVLRNVLKVGSAMTPSYNPLIDLAMGWYDWSVNGVSPVDYRGKKMIPDQMLGAGLEYEWKPMMDFTLSTVGLNGVVNLYSYDPVSNKGAEYLINSLPIVGRALKYSRPGAAERLRVLKEDMYNEQKGEILDRNNLVYEFILDYRDDPSSIDEKVAKYTPMIMDKLYGTGEIEDYSGKYKAIERYYKTALLKGVKNDMTEVVRFVESVSSNKMKARLVKEWGNTVGIFEMNTGIDYMLEEGILSKEAYNEILKLQEAEQK